VFLVLCTHNIVSFRSLIMLIANLLIMTDGNYYLYHNDF
jgi:hypothetical protein